MSRGTPIFSRERGRDKAPKLGSKLKAALAAWEGADVGAPCRRESCKVIELHDEAVHRRGKAAR